MSADAIAPEEMGWLFATPDGRTIIEQSAPHIVLEHLAGLLPILELEIKTLLAERAQLQAKIHRYQYLYGDLSDDRKS